MKLCMNCERALSGKQRNYCSDRCRKAYKRALAKADEATSANRPEISEIGPINGHLRTLLDLSENMRFETKYHLRTILFGMGKYEDVWVRRCENTPLRARPHVAHVIKNPDQPMHLQEMDWDVWKPVDTHAQARDFIMALADMLL